MCILKSSDCRRSGRRGTTEEAATADGNSDEAGGGWEWDKWTKSGDIRDAKSGDGLDMGGRQRE